MFSKTEFNPTPERAHFPSEEEKILKYWNEIDAFKQQLEKTKDLPPYTFYDGPPFATGTPHYGHIAAGTIKDVVCRYASQTGHYVSRRFGWDCHGLPVEFEIDKELGIKSKQQVFDMGIDKYNAHCRGIVMRYSKEWEIVVNRFARWIDFEKDYKTMNIDFMESVWHVFKQLFDKGHVYRGRKIMPWSNGCNTVLSNFEVQQNYKEVSDPQAHVSFPLVSDPNVKFVAWTTTPWTLPSNLALAVNPEFTYVKVKDFKRNEVFIIAECRLKNFFGKQKYEVVEKIKGKQFEGVEYEPLFDFFIDRKKDGCFRVQCANFVTDSDGTGIVHCAPGFGEDDYKMCVEKKIIHPDNPPVPVDENGRFTKEISTFEGMYIKDADDIILKNLKESGRLVKKGACTHNYPYCWRSDTPLIYKAVTAWFIGVTNFKEDLVKNNQKAVWVPKNIQDGKFHNWLSDAKDWCFSRNRFWGNPIPLWVSDDGEEIVCIGSVKQLEELTGTKVTDLHREYIDKLTIESKQGKGKLRRIDEVFDCWFESGSMPYAQVHYPFSTSEEEFNKIFPADFIGEGIDQTRGWFYTLNVLSTGTRNSNPYKNLIVNGLVLTEDGKKMSKRLKNYPDPLEVCNEFGADAVRLYLINSPLVKADNLNFSKKGVESVVKEIFLPWYNAYRFLIQNITKYEARHNKNFVYAEHIESLLEHYNVTDKWIQSALQNLIRNVRKEQGQYKLYNVVPPLIKFLENLTNWYVRLNRTRIKGQVDDINMEVSLNVLFDVLLKVNVLMSPVVPYITDMMYQNMKLVINKDSKQNQPSIHHLFIPDVNEQLINDKVAEQMTKVMSIIETARKLREQKKISLKQPIMSLTIVNKSQELFDELAPFLNYIREQINVEDIKHEQNVDKYVKLEALPNLPVLGPKFKGNKSFGDVKKEIANLNTAQLQKFKEEGTIELAGNKLEKVDILISQKFVVDNIKEHEAIGGQKVIVLLDIQQNEELKIRGLAREIITRVQKLKKKAKLNVEDPILIFYKFGDHAKNLNEAVNKQAKNIENAVKKPFLNLEDHFGYVTLASDSGSIDEEQYSLKICSPGPVFNSAAMQQSFGDNAKVLRMAVLSFPYNKTKGEKAFKVRLDGNDCIMEEGKHYRNVI